MLYVSDMISWFHLPLTPPLLHHPPSSWPMRVWEIMCRCTLFGLQFGQTKNYDSAFRYKYVWSMYSAPSFNQSTFDTSERKQKSLPLRVNYSTFIGYWIKTQAVRLPFFSLIIIINIIIIEQASPLLLILTVACCTVACISERTNGSPCWRGCGLIQSK